MAIEDDHTTVTSVFNFDGQELVIEDIPLEEFERIIDANRAGYGLDPKILARFEAGETII